jgi:RNA polymerase sigma-70 factor (ECF subfamily)
MSALQQELGSALEAEIRAEHRAGDHQRAATIALEHYGPEILGYLISKMRSESEAAEVFSAFCLDLWAGLARFEWRCSFRTWAYALASHAAARHHRDPKRWRALPLEAHPHLSALEAKIRTHTAPFRRTGVKSKVRALRDELAAEDQELLTLRIDKGLSWEDVARVMLGPDALADPARIAQRSAALRKRFERLKSELRERARRSGLLSDRAG